MKSSVVKSVVAILGVLLTGCAVGYDYRHIVADIDSSGTASISVAVHDQRAYVLSGDKAPDFAGLARNGYGMPFTRSTLSGRPLADDMNVAIVASLTKKGYKTVPVTVSYSDSGVAVLDAMKAARTERMLLLTVNEWKSDLNPYHDLTLFYDVRLSISDHDGNIRAEKTIAGRDSFSIAQGGGFWDPEAYGRKAAPEAFKKKIEELLNSPDIAKALQ